MTIRQLHYRLVSTGTTENTDADYKKLSRNMTKARQDGRIPYAWIVDRSRPEYSRSVWEDAAAYGRAVSKSYHKNYWSAQPRRCEIWTEKDAIIGSIEPVTEALGVTVRVSRGFNSTTRVYEMAEVITASDKPMVVFFLGDHDPSGRAIETDMHNRIREYGAKFALQRLAIHAKDIKTFRLPPLRIKEKDTRAAFFEQHHGTDCVELDALPPVELRRRIEEAVTSLLDMEKWNRAVQVEKVELASIQEFVKAWPGSKS